MGDGEGGLTPRRTSGILRVLHCGAVLLGEGTPTNMQDEDNRITTLEPRGEPTARQIIDELLESIVAATSMNVFTRLLRCDNTRRCMWTGKTGTGRLPAATDDANEMVFRWPGAPDVGVPVCDKIVRWLSMKRMSVLNRGDMRIAPRRPAKTGAEPEDMAGVWQDTMEYFKTVQDWNLAHGFELFSTCVEEFGYGVVMADWLKKQRMEKVTISLQTITDAFAAAARQDVMTAALAQAGGAEVDPAQVLTPEVQAQIVEMVAMKLEMMLAMTGPDEPAAAEMLMSIDPRMSEQEARAVLRDLRRHAGDATSYHAPRDDGGVFEIEALVPWVNCLHPHDLTGDGRAEWFAVPRYWSEATLRDRARAEKWNPAATKELLDNQKNKFFSGLYGQIGVSSVPDWALNGSGIGLVPDMQAMEKMPRWLVVYVWRKITTREGRPMVYKAVVNPNMPDQMLLWESTDLEDLPWLVDTSEPVTYAMQARGVADIVTDKQNFIKDRMDEEGARGQLGSNPPLLRTQNQNVKIHPGFQFYTKRGGGGRLEGTEFMQVPAVDAGSIGLMEKAEQIIEEFYFRGETTSDEDKRMYHEYITYKSVRCLRELYRLLWRLVQENIEELQVSNINGRQVKLNATRDQLQGEADITIGVHLDGYSDDAADKFIKVYAQMVQADRMGAIDPNEGMNIVAQLLSPTYARRLVTTAKAASGRAIDDQENRIAKIMAGVPVRYDEHVSNPEMRMQVLQQWAQLPGNVERAMSDPTIAQMFQKEQEQLKFQTEQQTVNPTTGRTGVKPNTPEELAA